MPAAMLDTLRCAQSLKEAGFTQQQADGTARVLGDALAGVATKEDLAATKKDLDEAIAGLRTEMHHGFAAQKAEMNGAIAALKADMDTRFADIDMRFAAQKADMDAGFSAQRAHMDRALAEPKTEITQLHTKHDALDRQLKFVLGLLGLLFAMSAYNFLRPGPVAAPAPTPAHAEAPQALTPPEDQASQAAPAEPNRTLPIKAPKGTAPG